MLSKSKIRNGVEKGVYTGWDDPQLGTLKALRRRGFLPEAIRQLILDVGVRPSEATISWDNLCAINRKLLDPQANRYFFVENPIKLTVENAPIGFSTKIPYHPNYPERGFRSLTLSAPKVCFLISSKDRDLFKSSSLLRLMHLFNVKIVEQLSETEYLASFVSIDIEEAKRFSLPIIHWVLAEEAVKAQVLMPGRVEQGFCEKACLNLKPGTTIQFVRFGFCKIEDIQPGYIKAVFAHN